MQGIVTAALMFVWYACASSLAVRAYAGQNYYKIFIATYLLSLPFFHAIHSLLWESPLLAPVGLAEPERVVDALIAFLLFTMAAHAFWNFAYGGALNGFSAGILASLFKENTKVDVRSVIKRYQDASSKNTKLSQRLSMLVEKGYLKMDGAAYRLTPTGRLITRLSGTLKIVLNIGKGG